MEAIEFRSKKDDAWYDVNLAVDGETLIVSYLDFDADHNEYFRAGDFKTTAEIEAMERRFRPHSPPFQDRECPTIRKDTHVCAFRSFNRNLKYFDAHIIKVTNKKHTLDKHGEEKCRCVFELLWRHGRYGGRNSSMGIGRLCKILPSDNLDPVLTEFVRLSRQCLSLNACTTPPPSSRRTPPCNPNSSSKRVPSCNNGLSSEGTVDHNHDPSPQRAATPNHDSSSKKIPISRLCSFREGVPACNSTLFGSESATCSPNPSLRESAIHNPCPFREIEVRKRVSFAQEAEVIPYVELSSETNDADDQFSEGVALGTFDSSSRRTTVNNANSFSKRVSSCEDIADCNTNQSRNEVAMHSAGASGRIAAHSTGSHPINVAASNNVPQSEETVLVSEKSVQDKENGASGHECERKITWKEWILEQRRKRKYRCAVRTEEGRQHGLCKKNRRGKLEIRLGWSRR